MWLCQENPDAWSTVTQLLRALSPSIPALTQQWDPQLAPEERVDLLELAAQHLLLLRGWNAARGWLQAKKKKTGKFNPSPPAPADGHERELFMS